MSLFGLLFGFGKKKIKEAMEQGAIVIDVRSSGEFASGHAEGSINIPLDKIEANIKKIKNYNTPIVVCCASGMRSGMAQGILKKNGIENVVNAGRWSNV